MYCNSMRKRPFIIILILVIVIGGIVGWFAYVNRAQLGGAGELFSNTFPESETAPFAEDALPEEKRDAFEREDVVRTGTTADVRIVYKKPVSGAIAFEREEETFFRFVERESGHVFEVRADGAENPRRISNTTLPGIHRALWLDPDTFVLQYLGEEGAVETFRARIAESDTATAGAGSIRGSFLDPQITDIAASPDGGLAYLSENEAGIRALRTDQSGDNPQTVFRSPLTEWLIEWPGVRAMTLLTKPSFDTSGFFYVVDPQTGVRSAVLRTITALTARANADADTILYSERADGVMRTNVYDRDADEIRGFPFATLPEKCIWSANSARTIYCAVPQSLRGEYPDIWYQGIVSFSDDIWRVDLEAGDTELLFTETRTHSGVDGINLALSPDEDYLLFINKKDYSLWSVRLDDTETEDETIE